jgi:hypothetical protein
VTVLGETLNVKKVIDHKIERQKLDIFRLIRPSSRLHIN